MSEKTWKTIAIIFIILFILETLLFAGLIYIGQQEINRDTECQINICADYDAFIYDRYTQTCYCYRNNEVVLERWMK